MINSSAVDASAHPRVVERGAGEPLVVLVHGAMDSAAGFDRVADLLPDTHVLRYDRRGYAASRSMPKASSLHDHVADLMAVVGGRPAVGIGHSVGGAVVLLAALRHPNAFRSIGIFEMPMGWTPWWPSETAATRAQAVAEVSGMNAAGESFAKAMFGRERWSRLPLEEQNSWRADGETLIGEFRAMRLAARELSDVRPLVTPVGIGSGSRSSEYNRRAALELSSLIGGARLTEIPDAPHGAHIAKPAAFAAWVHSVIELGKEQPCAAT
jgi:pimeloyl-ACP methyl ester carboxylesterase